MMIFVGKVASCVNWELYMMLNNIGKIIVIGMTDSDLYYLSVAPMFFCSCLSFSLLELLYMYSLPHVHVLLCCNYVIVTVCSTHVVTGMLKVTPRHLWFDA